MAIRKKSSRATTEGQAAQSDWRGETLARVRALIQQAEPEVVEEVKWRKPSNGMAGVPVWSRDGIICTGETYKAAIKLTFAKGAALADPEGSFSIRALRATRAARSIFTRAKHSTNRRLWRSCARRWHSMCRQILRSRGSGKLQNAETPRTAFWVYCKTTAAANPPRVSRSFTNVFPLGRFRSSAFAVGLDQAVAFDSKPKYRSPRLCFSALSFLQRPYQSARTHEAGPQPITVKPRSPMLYCSVYAFLMGQR
jgi:hypothetical protein